LVSYESSSPVEGIPFTHRELMSKASVDTTLNGAETVPYIVGSAPPNSSDLILFTAAMVRQVPLAFNGPSEGQCVLWEVKPVGNASFGEEEFTSTLASEARIKIQELSDLNVSRGMEADKAMEHEISSMQDALGVAEGNLAQARTSPDRADLKTR